MCLRTQGAICAGAVLGASVRWAGATSLQKPMPPETARCEFTRSQSSSLLQTPDPGAGLIPRYRFHPRQSQRAGLSFGDEGGSGAAGADDCVVKRSASDF